MMKIQERRINYKPFEYPEVLQFIEAINKSFWVHSEVDFTADVQDFKSNLSPIEQEVIKRSLLSIAQVEVGVKTFWGDLYRHFPKPEFNGLGATFAECYIEGTEVLTKTGWKDFRDLIKGEEVATFNNRREISFMKPSHYISKSYVGKMFKLSSKDHLSYITPKHKLTLYDKNKLQYHEEAEKVSFNNSDIRIPVSYGVGFASELAYNKYLTDWDRLRIAIQADGHKRFFRLKDGSKQERGIDSNKILYELTFSKQRKIDRLQSILNNLPDIQYYRRDYNSGKTCFEVFLDRKENNLKSFEWILEDIRLTDSYWSSGIVSELSYWDGQYLEDKKDCKIKYSTTNELNADIIQIVGTLAGYKTNIQIREDLRKESFSDSFILSFNKNRETLPITSLTKEEVDYNGRVYCVTIPSTGNLITRYNKKVFWSGNCEFRHSEAYSRLLEVLGFNDEFEDLLSVPIFAFKLGMIEGTLARDKNDIVKKLLFFTIVIENSSLFSQFANILSFTRFKGYMKNVSNIIGWTSVDEQIHANAGIYIMNEIFKELTQEQIDDLEDELKDDILMYMNVEKSMLDWIYEKGELEFFTKEDMQNFMKYRVDESLERLGFSKLYNITSEQYAPMKWFEEEISAGALDDFFAKRPVDYTKHDKSITANDLF